MDEPRVNISVAAVGRHLASRYVYKHYKDLESAAKAVNADGDAGRADAVLRSIAKDLGRIADLVEYLCPPLVEAEIRRREDADRERTEKHCREVADLEAHFGPMPRQIRFLADGILRQEHTESGIWDDEYLERVAARGRWRLFMRWGRHRTLYGELQIRTSLTTKGRAAWKAWLKQGKSLRAKQRRAEKRGEK